MEIQLNYIEKGVGEPLVLLHGNNESSTYFIHQINFFSKYFRVIAPDTRGHGSSPRGYANFSISRFADDLSSFLDSLDIPSANILGFSDGGNIAVTFALRYPSKVIRLILNGANIDPSGVKPFVQIPIKIGYAVSSLFANFSENAAKNSEMLGLMVNEPYIPASELNSISVPTLVIVGSRDIIKYSHSRLIYRSIPNAEYKTIRGGHFIAYDNPREFNSAVFRFLKKRSETSI
ncbi:MAG: alpha/beta hydrolase [Oscillospiraceae bacterium]|nr:alpha/beta hydrolase [Oscillospiraceae bacterium]